VPLGQRPRLPHWRTDPELTRRAQEHLQDGLGLGPASRHVGPRARDALDENDLRRQRAVHGEQGAAGRADRRHRHQPEAPAAGRREGPVDRGCADRARNEEGRRRKDDHVVPLQAHSAADQLRRQPHLPHPHRESRARPARAAGSEIDPLALPALPPRGHHPTARSWTASKPFSTRSTRSSRPSASRTARPMPPRRS